MERNNHNTKTTQHKKKNNYITYDELNNRLNEIERVQRLGITLIHKKNMFKAIGGMVLVGVGVITLPLPTGSIILIALGLSLMASGGINIIAYKRGIFRKLRYKFKRVFIW